eukprot:scaffold21597_cov108-Isochrysis_galbana.AAC.2
MRASSADHATAPMTGNPDGAGLSSVHGVSPSRLELHRSPGYETRLGVLPSTRPVPAGPLSLHTRAVPSLEPESRALPQLDQHRLVTSCRWPRRVATSCGADSAAPNCAAGAPGAGSASGAPALGMKAGLVGGGTRESRSPGTPRALKDDITVGRLDGSARPGGKTSNTGGAAGFGFGIGGVSGGAELPGGLSPEREGAGGRDGEELQRARRPGRPEPRRGEEGTGSRRGEGELGDLAPVPAQRSEQQARPRAPDLDEAVVSARQDALSSLVASHAVGRGQVPLHNAAEPEPVGSKLESGRRRQRRAGRARRPPPPGLALQKPRGQCRLWSCSGCRWLGDGAGSLSTSDQLAQIHARALLRRELE